MKIKKGLNFLPDISIKKLENLYKKEKNAKAKVRLLCALHRKEGKSLPSIAKDVGLPTTTVNDCLDRLQGRGLEGRYSVKQSGRPSSLTKEQEKETKIMLNYSPEEQDLPFRFWTTKILMYVLEKKYSVVYKPRNVQRLVEVWGFSFKKARPEHKFADVKEQERFKKNFQKKFHLTLGMDGRYSILTRVFSR